MKGRPHCAPDGAEWINKHNVFYKHRVPNGAGESVARLSFNCLRSVRSEMFIELRPE